MVELLQAREQFRPKLQRLMVDPLASMAREAGQCSPNNDYFKKSNDTLINCNRMETERLVNLPFVKLNRQTNFMVL